MIFFHKKSYDFLQIDSDLILNQFLNLKKLLHTWAVMPITAHNEIWILLYTMTRIHLNHV